MRAYLCPFGMNALQVEATVTVLVEDDPEPPVFNTPAVISVVENEPAGSSVGAVLVSDPDLDDHLDIMLYEPSESFMFGKPTCINDVSLGQGKTHLHK